MHSLDGLYSINELIDKTALDLTSSKVDFRQEGDKTNRIEFV